MVDVAARRHRGVRPTAGPSCRDADQPGKPSPAPPRLLISASSSATRRPTCGRPPRTPGPGERRQPVQRDRRRSERSERDPGRATARRAKETEDAASRTTPPRRSPTGETEMQMGRRRGGARPPRASVAAAGCAVERAAGQQYHPYTVKFDEVVEVDADQLCDAEELSRLRNHLDQQLSTCRAWSASSPTACSAG